MAELNYIIYKSDVGPSMALGNKTCSVKPVLTLNYDVDGVSGKYGISQVLNTPNASIQYIQVLLKYNQNFDITTGGLVELNDIQLEENDKIWLTNQSNSSENGVYLVKSNTWILFSAVNSSVFIDLGATAIDQLDGNISRNIITNVNIDFSKVGLYSITYYIINSLGILSKATRRIKIIRGESSISPTNEVKITDLKIFTEYDSDILDVLQTQSNNSTSNCTFEIGTEPNTPCQDPQIYIRKDGLYPFINNQSMGNNRLTEVADAINDQDAVNLRQVHEIVNNYHIEHITLTCGMMISMFSVVYLNSNGYIYIANCNDITQMGKIIGIALQNGILNDQILVARKGIISGFTGLQIGVRYFFTNTGIITSVVPVLGFTQNIGIAISSTELLFELNEPIGITQIL